MLCPSGTILMVTTSLDRADNGIPLDGWAMSGPATRSVPSFADTKVSVADDTDVALEMVYAPK